MPGVNNKFAFLIALVISVGVILACNKSKDTSSSEDTKKETTSENKSTDTKSSDTKSSDDSKSSDTKSSGNTGGVSGKLYFCEDYKGKEIGVSDRFTPGWLTVMVKTDEPLGVGKVELRLTKVKDADGNKISEKIMDTVPFDIQPDWDYTYFQDKDRLRFSSPGTYKVTLQKTDGTPMLSGEVEVVSK